MWYSLDHLKRIGNTCSLFYIRIMVWYGMVWYGMVWYGMVWYGMVWYGMVWYGMVWYGMVWYGIVLYGMVWYRIVSYGLVWYRMVCHELNQFNTHKPTNIRLKASLEFSSAQYFSLFPQHSFLLSNKIFARRDSDFATLLIHYVFNHLFHYDR